jgi:DNA-binding protein H-NS
MKLIVKVLFLISAICLVQGQRSGDTGRACMALTLKQKGMLESDFPSANVDSSQCLFLTIIMKSLVNQFYEKFDTEVSINADCAKEKLDEKDFLSYLMKKDVIEMSTELSQEKIIEMSTKNKNDMRRVLDETATECDSDKTWAGIFDDVLGIKNTTQAVLEEDYCVLSHLLDNNVITLDNFDRNPEKIDTSNLDCKTIVENKLKKLKADVKKAYEEKGLRGPKIECLVNKFTDSHLNIMLGMKELEKLDITPAQRAQNKGRLEESLQGFLQTIFACVFA